MIGLMEDKVHEHINERYDLLLSLTQNFLFGEVGVKPYLVSLAGAGIQICSYHLDTAPGALHVRLLVRTGSSSEQQVRTELLIVAGGVVGL